MSTTVEEGLDVVEALPTRGPEEFARQTRLLGQANVTSDGVWVEFDLDVPAGSHAGTTVRIAAEVPLDFPDTPPTGPHVRPRLQHPHGAVHESGRGPQFVYWSRPAQNWATERTVRAWLRHVRSVFGQA